MMAKPVRLVHSQAPQRINDIGGWTDTWFAGEGKVLNLAIGPPVEVQVKAFTGPGRSQGRVLVRADNYCQAFRFDPQRPSRKRHPLLQFAIATIPWPRKYHLEVRIQSPLPAGISTGTSASVSVALLAALSRLAGQPLDPARIAKLAHAVETEKLGLQSGIQDQISAAYGGVCYIHMARYPQARVTRLSLRSEVLSELNRRLVLVGLGRPHRSSEVHEQVIARLTKGGALIKQLERMRGLAEEARSRLEQGDLESYGRIMCENNECQRGLSHKLISPEADEVIRLARKRRAAGWKVNGAGGRGGSLTLLAAADDGLRRALLQDILALGKGIRPLPHFLSSSGLAAWDAGPRLDPA
jgi:D-glycero-alpha-D-manno-heptose-7-phosphate kinase